MTASTVIDSLLFRDAFGTAAMRDIFSDTALIARYVEVEIALAKAEARVGVIPADATAEIARRSDASMLDVDMLRKETEHNNKPNQPEEQQLVKQCGEAGRYVH